MEFWLIMIAFIVMGGSCSLAGTWWDRKNKKDKKEEKKQTLQKNETQAWISNTKQLLSYNIRDFYEVQTSKLLMGVYVLRLLRY